MRIAIFTDSYLPYTSGVVNSIETFKEELASLGQEVYIFAPNYPNCQPEEGVFRFLSFPAPTNRNFTLAIPLSRTIKKTISRWEPDIIHVHSPFILGRLGASYATRLGIPLVFTFHTLYEYYVHYVPFVRRWTRTITRHYYRNFCNRCDLVIVPTKSIGEHLVKIGIQAPIKSIPTGIKLEEFTSMDETWLRRAYGIPEQERILLFVGRLGQEKNIPFLLQSFKRIVTDFPATHLMLVGGGPEEEFFKRQVKRLGLDRKVTFTGLLPKEKVIKCYAGADIFVFASVTETQGLVIAEAKAAGLPVVAVRAFGVKEMVEDGEDGFLTEEEVESFTGKIKILLQNEELRQKFGQRARISVEPISARNCALELLRSYQFLLEQKVFFHRRRIS